MRKLLTTGLAALLLLAPAVAWSETLGHPWSRTIDGVTEVQEGLAIVSNGTGFVVAGSIHENFQMNGLNGDTGDDIWAHTFDFQGATDAARAVNVDWVRTVGAGFVTELATGFPRGHVRYATTALEHKTTCAFTMPNTGFPTGSTFNALTQTPTLIVAAGVGNAPTGTWLVQELDTNCQPEWNHTLSGLGASAGVNAVASEGLVAKRIVAAGFAPESLTPTDRAWTVVAYDLDGAVKWISQTTTPGRDNEARAVVMDGSKAFVAGEMRRPNGRRRAVIVAHEPLLGAVAWQSTDKPVGYGQSSYYAIALDGDLVIAVGYAKRSATKQDWLVTAHDAATGAIVWQDVFDGLGFNDVAKSVTIVGDYVLVAGEVKQTANKARAHVRIYGRNGDGLGGPDLLFEDTPMVPKSTATSSAGHPVAGGASLFGVASNKIVSSGQESTALVKTYLVSP